MMELRPRATNPISTVFGYDRGNPIDRRYIEHFLARHARDIKGHVMEVGDNSYTMRFGGDHVTQSDVLNRYPGHPQTTIVGDLAQAGALPAESFDCIVLTQTLQLIFELSDAILNLRNSLVRGGVLLVTVPWITPLDRHEWKENWYWSLTPAALRRLLESRFGEGTVSVASYGNVLSAMAFLHGLAEHELTPEELDLSDPYLPVLVAGRAQKSLASGATVAVGKES